MSEEEIKKPDAPIFHVGVKKKAEKSFFFLWTDFITSDESLTKEYTDCRLTSKIIRDPMFDRHPA